MRVATGRQFKFHRTQDWMAGRPEPAPRANHRSTGVTMLSSRCHASSVSQRHQKSVSTGYLYSTVRRHSPCPASHRQQRTSHLSTNPHHLTPQRFPDCTQALRHRPRNDAHPPPPLSHTTSHPPHRPAPPLPRPPPPRPPGPPPAAALAKLPLPARPRPVPAVPGVAQPAAALGRAADVPVRGRRAERRGRRLLRVQFGSGAGERAEAVQCGQL